MPKAYPHLPAFARCGKTDAEIDRVVVRHVVVLQHIVATQAAQRRSAACKAAGTQRDDLARAIERRVDACVAGSGRAGVGAPGDTVDAVETHLAARARQHRRHDQIRGEVEGRCSLSAAYQYPVPGCAIREGPAAS